MTTFTRTTLNANSRVDAVTFEHGRVIERWGIPLTHHIEARLKLFTGYKMEDAAHLIECISRELIMLQLPTCFTVKLHSGTETWTLVHWMRREDYYRVMARGYEVKADRETESYEGVPLWFDYPLHKVDDAPRWVQDLHRYLDLYYAQLGLYPDDVEDGVLDGLHVLEELLLPVKARVVVTKEDGDTWTESCTYNEQFYRHMKATMEG